MLQFETLTWVPIDRRLIDPTLLTNAERAWLNAYHAQIVAKLDGSLDETDAAWLKDATAPI